MTTETEALRAQFERRMNLRGWSEANIRRDGLDYTSTQITEAWHAFQAGYAAAKAETADVVAKERERASVLYDMLLNRPGLNTGLESEYLAWTSKCHLVTGAYKAAIRAGAKEPSDADQA